MSKVLDLENAFDEWFYEHEFAGMRAERFYDNLERANPMTIKNWLEVAFRMGAKVAMEDTIATLRDYGTAVSGVNHYKNLNATDAFDMSAKNLEAYYKDILKKEGL